MPPADYDHPAHRHLAFARAKAAEVRKMFKFYPHSQEAQDLEQVAYVELLKALERFDPARVPPGGDPDAAFRGFAAKAIRKECAREALRMRNGGMYYTTRTPNQAPRIYPGCTPEAVNAPENDTEEDEELAAWLLRLAKLDERAQVGGEPDVEWYTHLPGWVKKGRKSPDEPQR